MIFSYYDTEKRILVRYVYEKLFSNEILPPGIKNNNYDLSDMYFSFCKVHLVFFFNWARVHRDQEDFSFLFIL